MKIRSRTALPAAAVLVLSTVAIGCADSQTPEERGTSAADAERTATTDALVPLDPPAVPGAGNSSLFTTIDGGVLLSWLEPVGGDDGEHTSTRRGRFALRFARLEGDAWSQPRTIAEGDDFFVNWADFPVIIESEGVLAAHWLQMNGGRGTNYDVHITRSLDGGATWTESVVPHHDGTPTEHGFVSMVPEPGGGFTAVWLDGRAFAGGEGVEREMSLRGTTFAADGGQGDVSLLDPRICECCQTSAAYVGGDLVAVYRDRDADEVREIAAVRRTADGWQEPVMVGHDNWQIPGCPVNGPAIVGSETLGAVAWFSMPAGVPEVKVAFTEDGAGFSTPILLDSGPSSEIDGSNPRQVGRLAEASSEEKPIPLGRVGISWAADQTAVVSWVVANGRNADLILQTVSADGTLGERHTIASTSSSRPSGFPRIARDGDRLVIAWTEPGANPSLRVGTMALPLH